MMAGRYLVHAERFGSLRDVAAALLLLSRARAMTGDLGPAAEIIAAADGVLARIPEPGELEVDRLLAELTLAHYRDADWPKLAERISAVRTAEPQPAGLLLAAEEAVADARGGREPEARPLIAGILEALADVPPLAFARDGALFSALTAAWEIGAAEHALAGRTLVERAVASGVGGSHAATPRLALARLAGLAGNVASAREQFAEERLRLDAAGLTPLRSILDHDEAITIAAAGSGFGEAGALLERAIGQFDALGMTGWADRSRWLQAAGFESAAQPGGRLHFSYPAGLSRREADLVRLLAAGSTLTEAATQLDVDESVFDRHLASALEKLGAANLDELPRYARRHGLGGG
jgi:DNA-binding CsgD family transcriptional regulator